MEVTKQQLTELLAEAFDERFALYEPHHELIECGFLLDDVVQRLSKTTPDTVIGLYVWCSLLNTTTHESETRIYDVHMYYDGTEFTVEGFMKEWVERRHYTDQDLIAATHNAKYVN